MIFSKLGKHCVYAQRKYTGFVMNTKSDSGPGALPGFGLPLAWHVKEMIPTALFQQPMDGYEYGHLSNVAL